MPVNTGLAWFTELAVIRPRTSRELPFGGRGEGPASPNPLLLTLFENHLCRSVNVTRNGPADRRRREPGHPEPRSLTPLAVPRARGVSRPPPGAAGSAGLAA